MSAIVGIGLDLVEISRVTRSLDRWGARLVDKLMDPEEASRLPAGGEDRARAVAAAIALKEAASKALGTGWSRGVHWRQVIARTGPPATVLLTARAAHVARARGSSGATVTSMEARGDLLLAEVWLLE